MTLISRLGAGALALSLATAALPAWAQTKIRLAHELPVTHYGHVYIDRWAKLARVVA